MTASEYSRAEGVGTNEQAYRKEWATLTGRSESEIYVPEGIRVSEQPTLSPPPKRKDTEPSE